MYQMIQFQQIDKKKVVFQSVTLIVLVRMTVPATDKKWPTSRDLGIVSLVSSGHTGRPTDLHGKKDTKKKNSHEAVISSDSIFTVLQMYC